MEGDARPAAPRSAAALLGVGGRDGHVVERLHPRRRVVAVLLHAAAIDDESDVVNCNGRLGNVGREYDLAHARRRARKGETLLLGRDGRVDGKDPRASRLRHKLARREESFLDGGDLLDALQEDEHRVRLERGLDATRVRRQRSRPVVRQWRHQNVVGRGCTAIVSRVEPERARVDAHAPSRRSLNHLGGGQRVAHTISRIVGSRTVREPSNELNDQIDVDHAVLAVGERSRHVIRVRPVTHAQLGLAELAVRSVLRRAAAVAGAATSAVPALAVATALTTEALTARRVVVLVAL